MSHSNLLFHIENTVSSAEIILTAEFGMGSGVFLFLISIRQDMISEKFQLIVKT